MSSLATRLRFATGTTPFSPADLSNLRGWWKADALALSNNDPVATWNDSSASGLNMTQATSGNRPTFKTSQVNGLPAVDFDGSSDFLSNSSSMSPTTGFWTAFAVVKLDSVTGTRAIVDADREGGARLAQMLRTDGTGMTTIVLTGTSPNVFSDSPGATLATGTWYILEAVYDGSSIEAFVDGTGNGSTSTVGTSPLSDGGGGARCVLGAHLDSASTPGTWFDGLIAEVVAYSDGKNSTDRGLVRAYLETKYAL